MINLKKLLSTCAVLVAVGFSGSLSALSVLTVDSTTSVGPRSVGSNQPYTFDYFDPSLGVLSFASFSINGNVTTVLSTPSTITSGFYTLSNRASVTFNNPTIGTRTVANVVVTNINFDGSTEASVMTQFFISSPLIAANFNGPGTYDVFLSLNSLTTSTNNINATVQVAPDTLNLTRFVVNYYYTPSVAVPELSTWLALGSLLVCAAMLARFRNRKIIT